MPPYPVVRHIHSPISQILSNEIYSEINFIQSLTEEQQFVNHSVQHLKSLNIFYPKSLSSIPYARVPIIQQKLNINNIQTTQAKLIEMHSNQTDSKQQIRDPLFEYIKMEHTLCLKFECHVLPPQRVFIKSMIQTVINLNQEDSNCLNLIWRESNKEVIVTVSSELSALKLITFIRMHLSKHSRDAYMRIAHSDLANSQDIKNNNEIDHIKHNLFDNHGNSILECSFIDSKIKPAICCIDFDVSLRTFGLRNSLLLQQYMQQPIKVYIEASLLKPNGKFSTENHYYHQSYSIVRLGALFIKKWGKQSGVIDSKQGYLTSYALNILWIYFLYQNNYIYYIDTQAIPSTILYNSNNTMDNTTHSKIFNEAVIKEKLKWLHETTPQNPSYFSILDKHLNIICQRGSHGACKYLNESEYEADLDIISPYIYNELARIILHFFSFYTYEFNWDNHVISIKSRGIITKNELNWMPDQSKEKGAKYLLCIEDPYENNLNLGRHIGVVRKIKVMNAFYTGLISLAKDKPFQSIFFEKVRPSPVNKADSPPYVLFRPQ